MKAGDSGTLRTISPKYAEAKSHRLEADDTEVASDRPPARRLSKTNSDSQGQLGLQRQNSYQRMLEKYNQKKEKLSSTRPERPVDLPLRAGTMVAKPNSQRGQQPQYLTYLEKTLEKSDLTIQTVNQMAQGIRQLEARVDGLQYQS